MLDLFIVHDRSTSKSWRVVHIVQSQAWAIARAQNLNREEGLARFGVVQVQVTVPRKRLDVVEALKREPRHVFC